MWQWPLFYGQGWADVLHAEAKFWIIVEMHPLVYPKSTLLDYLIFLCVLLLNFPVWDNKGLESRI